MRTGFFGYEKSKSALTAPAPLFMWGSRRGARNRATVRAGGNGGAAAACGSAAGADLYGAGLGVPAPHVEIQHKTTFAAGAKRGTWTRRAITASLANSALDGARPKLYHSP